MKTTFFLNSKWLLYIALLLSQATALAQTPYIEWQKSFGGDSADIASSIQQTTDGGYIVAGSSKSIDGDVTGNHGNDDFWIVKLDANANISWQQSFGGSDVDGAAAIQQTTDGGYIVAGNSNSNDGNVTGNHGSDDIWIVKLAANGTLSWQKSLGGSDQDVAYAIQQCTDVGYIVAGWTRSTNGDVIGNHGSLDCWVVKLDSSGALLWQKSLGGNDDDGAASIQQTTDGGYIVAGSSRSIDGDVTGNHGDYDVWIVKLAANGTLSWQQSFGGSDGDGAYAIQQTTDGGYIVAGGSNSIDGDVTETYGNGDVWVVKLAANGTLSWQKSFGGTNWDYVWSVEQATDGGYIVAGWTKSNDGSVTGNHGSYDYWVLKLTANGTLSWQRCLGGSNGEGAYSIQQTADGGYIVAGYSNSIDGDVTGNHGSADFWIVKLGTYGVSIDEGSMVGGLSVSPNPARDVLYIESDAARELVVLNMLGERLMAMRVVGKEEFDVSGLPSGVYWVRDIDSGQGQIFMKE